MMKMSSPSLAIILVVIIIAAASSLASGNEYQNQNLTKLFHLSDFHHDPFFGTKCAIGPCKNSNVSKAGLPGCDSSAEMIQGMLRAVARSIVDLNVQIAIIIYTGDHFRHGMADRCVGDSTEVAFEIIEFISTAFKQDLYDYISQYESEQQHVLSSLKKQKKKRSIHMVPIGHHQPFSDALRRGPSSSSFSNRKVLNTTDNTGNDDFVPDYYFNYSAQPNIILQRFSNSLLQNGWLQTPDQANIYSRCGYSYRYLDGLSIRVIILNTLLYATQLKPATSERDPCGQFAFMKSQLEDAKRSGHRVIIQSHIPPYFGLWKPDILSPYYAQYNALVAEYSGIIAVQLFGHIHRFQYGAMTDLKTNTFANMPPMFLGGPLTRASKTTPDFGVYSLDPSTFSVVDINQVVITENATDPLQASSWQMGPSFKQSLGLSDLSTLSLYNLGHAMRFDPSSNDKFQTYLKFEQGGRIPAGVSCTGSCQRISACELIAFTTLEDTKCSFGF